MTTTATPTTAQLQQLLPGQAFTWPPTGDTLTMVSCGKASFRAATPEGNVATFKSSPTRVVDLAGTEAPTDQAVGEEIGTEVGRFLDSRPAPVKRPSTPGRTRKGRALPAAKTGDPRTNRGTTVAALGGIYTKGASYGLQDGRGGTVAWVRASYLLVKVPGDKGASWVTVWLADGTEHPADSGAHAESIGRQLARKATK